MLVAARNPEKVRAADRARYERDKPKRRAAMDAYQQTPAGREAHRRASAKWAKANPGAAAKWAKANPEKRRAQSAVAYALRVGRLLRGVCEVCGAEKVHAHHDDYSKPLEVRWLCPKHHAANHAS